MDFIRHVSFFLTITSKGIDISHILIFALCLKKCPEDGILTLNFLFREVNPTLKFIKELHQEHVTSCDKNISKISYMYHIVTQISYRSVKAVTGIYLEVAKEMNFTSCNEFLLSFDVYSKIANTIIRTV